jgi:hypothetical protein
MNACLEEEAVYPVRREVRLECDPQLVETAVFTLLRDGPHAAEYHAGREACYAVPDEDREAAFAAYHREWFERLALAQPVVDIILEYPTVLRGTARQILAPAVRKQDEIAELFAPAVAAEGARPYLVLRLRPDAFGHPEQIVKVLRRELMHVSDMLDVDFGYDPAPTQFLDSEGVPTVIRDRYRVLWSIFVDARLYRAGHVDAATISRRLEEFYKVFPMLGERRRAVFEAIFAGRAWRHGDFMLFARNPGRLTDLAG